MKSFKSVLHSLKDDNDVRTLTEDESVQLKKAMLDAFLDIDQVCKEYHLTLMLIGGSVIGAVRHHGYIPWDDDLDVAMTRKDYTIFKKIFSKELGEKYILSAPNYKRNARNRYPQILIKNTVLEEIGCENNKELCKIKLDLFIIENIPDAKLIRYCKGAWCSALMFIATNAETYQEKSKSLQKYMCKTPDGAKYYHRMMRVGRLFSFLDKQTWYNMVDHACQYKKQTSRMGIPTGRGHYFGEIRPRETFVPTSQGMFEGKIVNLPGNIDDYCTNLYGDYMTVPPEDKREQHVIHDIKFSVK